MTTEKLESTSQSQTCTRKRSRSLVVCCPSGPLQLSKSQQNHSIWEVCSGNRWDTPKTATPAASTGQQRGPDSSPGRHRPYITQPLLQKLNELGYKVLPHPPYSPELLSTNCLDNFLQAKTFYNQQEAENAFQELDEFWSTNFYATGINKLNSHWQKCVDYNGSYFD